MTLSDQEVAKIRFLLCFADHMLAHDPIFRDRIINFKSIYKLNEDESHDTPVHTAATAQCGEQSRTHSPQCSMQILRE